MRARPTGSGGFKSADENRCAGGAHSKECIEVGFAYGFIVGGFESAAPSGGCLWLRVASKMSSSTAGMDRRNKPGGCWGSALLCSWGGGILVSLFEMAQVCGGTTFDFIARRKHDAALRMIARAADLWSAQGAGAVSVDSLTAVLLRIFLARWSVYGGVSDETRALEAWLVVVGTAEQEAESFSAAHPRILEVVPLLRAELSSAADQWVLGDPEQPPTAHALNAIESILFSHRLSPRPPAPQLPTTLGRVSIDP